VKGDAETTFFLNDVVGLNERPGDIESNRLYLAFYKYENKNKKKKINKINKKNEIIQF
jgi:hypothetical protein